MRVLVSGLLNIETTVAVKGFPIEYCPIDYPFFGIRSGVSGVGYNIAKALSTLGDEVELISFLADDAEGRSIREQLTSDNMSVDSIRTTLQQTPVSAVLYDPFGRRRIYCDLKDIQEQMLDPASMTAALLRCDIAALCNINFNRELIKAARKQGVLTATDVHVLSDIEDAYNRDFMENADVLFLSDENLPCAPEEFIRRLYERYHNRVIVIGMGARGAMLYDADTGEVHHVPAYPKAQVVNTVGAGDALFSAFVHGYAAGQDALSTLRRAVVFAGIKIGTSGASQGFCTESELDAAASSV